MFTLSLSRSPAPFRRQGVWIVAILSLALTIALLPMNGWFALGALFAVLLLALEERFHPARAVEESTPRRAAPVPDGGVTAGLAQMRGRGRDE